MPIEIVPRPFGASRYAYRDSFSTPWSISFAPLDAAAFDGGEASGILDRPVVALGSTTISVSPSHPGAGREPGVDGRSIRLIAIDGEEVVRVGPRDDHQRYSLEPPRVELMRKRRVDRPSSKRLRQRHGASLARRRTMNGPPYFRVSVELIKRGNER